MLEHPRYNEPQTPVRKTPTRNSKLATGILVQRTGEDVLMDPSDGAENPNVPHMLMSPPPEELLRVRYCFLG